MAFKLKEESPPVYTKELETLYNKEQDTILIEIKLKSLKQLFNTYDPAPFFEKDLDDDAIAYIVSTVKEFPLTQKQKLIIYLPGIFRKKVGQGEIKNAISHYFKYQHFLAKRNLKLKFKEARTEFGIALLFLFISLAISEWIAISFEGLVSRLIAEGIIITAWVAMWRPLDAILFEWLPIRKEGLVYEKISKMPIEVKFL